MSYTLLWIESLTTALLWAATLFAFSARSGGRWIARLPVYFLQLFPFVLFAALAVATGIFRVVLQLQPSWFGYMLSLLLAYIAGFVILHRKATAGWPVGRCALGLLTAGAITTMTLWNMDLEARAQGAAWQTEAGAILLSISPPQIHDEDNGAISFQKAFVRLSADETALNHQDSPLYSKTPESDPKAVELLKRHEQTLLLLRKGASMPNARFDHDYIRPSIRMLFPELGHARTACVLLALDARYEKSRGNIELAIKDLNAIYFLSRSIRDEPFLISTLVSIGVSAIGDEVLADVLPAVTTNEQLAGIHVAEVHFGPSVVQRTLQGEEAFGLSFFSDLMSNRETLDTIAAILNGEASRNQQSAISLDIEPTRLFLRVFLLPDDMAAYRRFMETYQQSAVKPYFQVRPHQDDLYAIRRSGIITSTIVPALDRAMETIARAQATHATAEVAFAMTQYRLENHSYPAALDALVPKYVDEIPLDPFDGKPLRLIQKGGDWIVYSVGADAKDDGGTPYDSKTRTGDFLFVLKQVKSAPAQ